MTLTVETTGDPSTLPASAWQDLARRAVDPNLYYEPWMLLPAVANRLTGSPELVVVKAGARWLGLFPLQRRRLHPRVPVTVLEPLSHDYLTLTTPLVDAADPAAVWRAFFGWLGRRRALWLDWFRLPTDGVAFRTMSDELERARAHVELRGTYTRAFYRQEPSWDAYYTKAVKAKQRTNHRAREKKLAAEGAITIEECRSSADGAARTAEFLALEASGWKGREGSALATQPASRDFFERAMRSAFADGRAQILALRLAGRAIAMKVNLIDRSTAYTWKVAYDEAYAKHSPGTLLELQSMQRLPPGVTAMDSSGVAENEPYDHLYGERREIARLQIAAGLIGKAAMAALPLARTLRARLQRSSPTGEQ